MTRGGKRPGAGRPSSGATKRVNVRVSPERLAAYNEAAARAGKPLSECVIEQLDAWAEGRSDRMRDAIMSTLENMPSRADDCHPAWLATLQRVLAKAVQV